jgi:hypothetical protein
MKLSLRRRRRSRANPIGKMDAAEIAVFVGGVALVGGGLLYILTRPPKPAA